MCPAVTVTKLNCIPANMAKINNPTPMIISGKTIGNIMKPNTDRLKGNKYLVIALATNMPKIVLITEAKIPTLILAKRASCNFVFFHIVTYLSNVQSVMGNCMYCDSLKEKRGKNKTGI